MNKPYIITFSICVMFSVAAVLLMIMLPDQVGVLEGNQDNYETMAKAKYTFESTKNISTDIIERDYVVTSDQMTTYQRNYLYIPGNSDPFSPKVTENTTGTDNSQSGTSTSTNTTTTNTNTNTSAKQEAENKTTNSNGGIKNPESTSK